MRNQNTLLRYSIEFVIGWERATDLGPHRRFGKFYAPDANVVFIDEFAMHDVWREMMAAYQDIKGQVSVKHPLFETEKHDIPAQIPVCPDLGKLLFPAHFRIIN